jgi:hypothetical protein
MFGSPVRVGFQGAGQGSRQPAGGSDGPVERLDQQTDREARLKAYRAKDQALDAVAEALDLELLD